MAKNMLCGATVTFDLRPPNSDQFVLDSKWTLVPNLMKFDQKEKPQCLQSWLLPVQRHTNQFMIISVSTMRRVKKQAGTSIHFCVAVYYARYVKNTTCVDITDQALKSRAAVSGLC